MVVKRYVIGEGIAVPIEQYKEFIIKYPQNNFIIFERKGGNYFITRKNKHMILNKKLNTYENDLFKWTNDEINEIRSFIEYAMGDLMIQIIEINDS